MRAVSIRKATPADRTEIRAVEEEAFGQGAEAALVEALVIAGDAVLELVAASEGKIVGHILFSRLHVVEGDRRFEAVALAPLAVAPDFQRSGIGAMLVREAHARLERAGERLSIVLGDPAYYGRHGYAHERAKCFESAWQCPALQALAWKAAPRTGRLAYAPAFDALAEG